MLTPILTVKTATPSAHVTTPEAVLPKEKATAAPATLSGRQSEAALRILETINKQLLGSDMPPKDALVRLLDTLARLLKLPQLPQESLLALSKRIAAAIEALPPVARLALEKQLGQRNVLLSARILAELVKPPLPEVAARFDAPLPRPANAQPAQVRPPAEQPAAQPPEQIRQPQQRPPEALPRPPAAVLVGGNFDASALQAALRSAFSAEEDAAIGDAGIEDSEEIAAKTVDGVEAEPSEHAATNAARAAGEAIPTLRSVARFLADDALALSRVEAIAAGAVDPEIREALEHALEADVPLELSFPDVEEPEQLSNAAAEPALVRIDGEPQPRPAKTPGTATVATRPASVAPPEHIESEAAPELGPLEEVPAGDKGTTSVRPETPAADRSARLIADALKVLVEAGLALTTEELEMPAESLFALAAVDDIEAILDEPLAFRGTAPAAEKTDPAERPAQDFLSEPEDFETGSTPRDALRNATPPADEHAREPVPQRLPETVLPREVPAFIAIPYPPAKTGIGSVSAEEEEEPQTFGRGEDDRSEPEGEAGKDETGDDGEGDDEAGASADAYELYRRLGGVA